MIIELLPKSFSRVIVELLIIFVGVTAAFMVENYREREEEQRQLEAAYDGLILELDRYATRTALHADAAESALTAWREAYENGQQTAPGYYRIPGSEMPPMAIWQTTVSSGIVNLMDPELAWALGYYYEELRGVSERFSRYAAFTEFSVLRTLKVGDEAFYDPETGEILPEYAAHMDLLNDFVIELNKLSAKAVELKSQIEATRIN